jgi:hypothetical protein
MPNKIYRVSPLINRKRDVQNLTSSNMLDKVQPTPALTTEEIARVLDFVEFMTRRQLAKKKQVDLDYQDQEQESLEGQLHWHCMICGHSWEGWQKVNPSPPPTCASCNRPNWSKCPKDGPHDVNCEDCKVIIRRQLRDMERLQRFAE